MSTPALLRRVRAVITAAVGVALPISALLLASAPAAAGSFPTAPKAHCGPGSLPETGLQGEVPLVDQLYGRSQQGYRCNLQLVGRYAGNGGAIMMAWYAHCAYMATGYAPTDPDYSTKKGVVVIDASDPRNPKETTRLQTPAMINPWEALKASDRSGLLATGEGGSFPLTGPGAAGPVFDVYDVKHDCAHPHLDSSVTLPDGKGHEGDFAPDGKTYYQSTLSAAPSKSIVAVDVSDPKHAHEITAWSSDLGPVHALQISDDGNRGYFMVAGMNAGSGDNDGLVIVDTSQIQQRKAHPTIRVLSHVFWHESGEATGEHDLWFISGENGFQIIKFTNGAYPFSPHKAASASAGAAGARSGEAGLPASGDSRTRALAGLGVIALGLAVGRLRRSRRA